MADFIIMDCGDKIKGESTIDGYKDKIELTEFNHTLTMSITSDPSNQKRTAGKPQHGDFSVTKYVDLASCSLITACNSGTVIPTVTVFVLQNEQGKNNPIISYAMTNVVISSIRSRAYSGDPKAGEVLTLNYSQITWTYKPQQAKGEVQGQDSAKWNVATNKAE